MKTILLLFISAMCISCTTRPTATFTDPVTGATATLNLGGTMMAKTEGVVASIEHGGTKLKYSSISEDSTEVPKHLITTAGIIAGGVILNHGEATREAAATTRHSTESAERLGIKKLENEAAETAGAQALEGQELLLKK